MKNMIVKFTINVVVISVLLALGGWFIYTLSQADAGIQSGILALIGVVTAGIMAHRSAKSREISARHFDDKRDGYTAFIEVMLQQMQAGISGGESKQEREMQQKVLEYKKILLIWADADVIKMWNNFEKEGLKGNNSIDILLRWDELLRSMRKDLGKDDSQLKKGELVALILKPEEKPKVMGGGK